MDKCTCKITPGTSAYGGNQIDSRGCEKHDTRDEIIEQLRQERDNALRYTELLIAERNAARAGEARAVEALKRIADICRPETQGSTSEGLLAHACIMSLETAECALSEQPALDWLAQQRREAAAEALEGIGARQTSASGPAAQKVETLIFLADTADKLARLDCELIDRAAMAQRAALFRECAAMMRERGESGWTAQFEREYKGKTLAVVEAGPIGWYWYVDGSADYEAEIAPTLAAAQAAAVAWVDEQEGK